MQPFPWAPPLYGIYVFWLLWVKVLYIQYIIYLSLPVQFLNRSVARTVNAVDTLAAYGLAYVIVKFFMGMLGEVKQAGLVLVHDRPGFHKILICVLVVSSSVAVFLIVIGEWHSSRNTRRGDEASNVSTATL